MLRSKPSWETAAQHILYVCQRVHPNTKHNVHQQLAASNELQKVPKPRGSTGQSIAQAVAAARAAAGTAPSAAAAGAPPAAAPQQRQQQQHGVSGDTDMQGVQPSITQQPQQQQQQHVGVSGDTHMQDVPLSTSEQQQQQLVGCAPDTHMLDAEPPSLHHQQHLQQPLAPSAPRLPPLQDLLTGIQANSTGHQQQHGQH